MTAQGKGGWTPGPWKIDYGHPRGHPGGISTVEGHKPVTRFGAFARPSSPEALANARLIAAAPTLIEALEEIASLADISGPVSRRDHDFDKGVRAARLEARDIARAAISLARGEPNV